MLAAERGVRVRLLMDDLYTEGYEELLAGLAGHPNIEVRVTINMVCPCFSVDHIVATTAGQVIIYLTTGDQVVVGPELVAGPIAQAPDEDLVTELDESTVAERQRVARPESLAGLTVGLLDISKARGDLFLDRLEEHLAGRGARVVRYKKPTFTKPAPIDLRQEIATTCDAVVEALADLGEEVLLGVAGSGALLATVSESSQVLTGLLVVQALLLGFIMVGEPILRREIFLITDFL